MWWVLIFKAPWVIKALFSCTEVKPGLIGAYELALLQRDIMEAISGNHYRDQCQNIPNIRKTILDKKLLETAVSFGRA